MSSSESHVEAIYCLGCNRRYRMRHAGERCPRCGVSPSLQQLSRVAETMFMTPDEMTPTDQLRIREARDARNGTEAISAKALSQSGAAGPGTSEGERGEESLVGRDFSVYHCESMIGRGGMGRVYLARHQRLNRLCALKILSLRTQTIDADYIARFHEEGRSAAALSHPNIVTVHAQGEEQGLHYLEMEYVPGNSLQQLLAGEGKLSPLRATSIVACIADGLATAHAGNVLHRDLKLDNILLSHSGVPKIVDFGLAKRVAAAGFSPDVQERLVGTPNYMAPELLLGQSATPASDIYALGVCWFHLISGRLPLVGKTLGELQQIVVDCEPPRVSEFVPEVPEHVCRAISTMLAKSPADRPSDGRAAWRILTDILARERGLDDLIQAAFRIQPVDLRREEAGYRVVVPLPLGRRQHVLIELTEAGSAARLVQIYSICGHATSSLFETALRLNSEIAHGAIAIRKLAGEPMFVMLNTYPLATVDPEEIRASVLEVATRADALERILSEHDAH